MPSITLEVDQARARALGLTPQDVAQTLQTLIGGVTVTTIRDREEKVDVVARAVPDERAALDQIDSLTVLSHDGAAVPVSQVAHVRYGDGRADHVAAQSRHGDHRARRCRRRRAAARCLDRAMAEAARNSRQPVAGLSHRNGRRDRGIAEGQRLDLHSVPDHAAWHADAADDPVAKPLAAGDRVLHGAARHRRRLDRAQSRPSAVRLRRAARSDRAGGHGHAQHRHPRRPDRERRARTRADARPGDRLGDGAPRPAGRAHRAARRSWR